MWYKLDILQYKHNVFNYIVYRLPWCFERGVWGRLYVVSERGVCIYIYMCSLYTGMIVEFKCIVMVSYPGSPHTLGCN